MNQVTSSATLCVYATGDRSLTPAKRCWAVSDVEIGGLKPGLQPLGSVHLVQVV